MTTLEQAARQALEALEAAKRIGGTCEAFPLYVAAQPAAQVAIEQEPVAWMTEAAWGTDVSLEKPDFGSAKWKAPTPKVTPLYTEPPKPQWQEIECPCCGDMARAFPPAPKRNPLTDVEICEMANATPVGEMADADTWHIRFARAIEAKLKKLNGV